MVTSRHVALSNFVTYLVTGGGVSCQDKVLRAIKVVVRPKFRGGFRQDPRYYVALAGRYQIFKGQRCPIAVTACAGRQGANVHREFRPISQVAKGYVRPNFYRSPFIRRSFPWSNVSKQASQPTRRVAGQDVSVSADRFVQVVNYPVVDGRSSPAGTFRYRAKERAMRLCRVPVRVNA